MRLTRQLLDKLLFEYLVVDFVLGPRNAVLVYECLCEHAFSFHSWSAADQALHIACQQFPVKVNVHSLKGVSRVVVVFISAGPSKPVSTKPAVMFLVVMSREKTYWIDNRALARLAFFASVK